VSGDAVAGGPDPEIRPAFGDGWDLGNSPEGSRLGVRSRQLQHAAGSWPYGLVLFQVSRLARLASVTLAAWTETTTYLPHRPRPQERHVGIQVAHARAQLPPSAPHDGCPPCSVRHVSTVGPGMSSSNPNPTLASRRARCDHSSELGSSTPSSTTTGIALLHCRTRICQDDEH
jgi:hypothetical protein